MPVVSPTALDDPSPGPPPAAGGPAPSGRALLVEDDRVHQLLAGMLLERAGWQLDVADDLASARQLWQAGRHRLVLCDLNLPDGHGVEFAQWLRSQPGGAQVRLLAYSADLDDAERALAAGFERFYVKPMTLAEVQALAPAAG